MLRHPFPHASSTCKRTCLILFSLIGIAHNQRSFCQASNLLYWSGQTNNNWDEKNWASDASGTSPSTSIPSPTTSVVFTASSASNPDIQLDSSASIAGLTFDSSQDISIGGSGNITVSGPVVVSPNLGNPTVSVPLVVAGSTGKVEILGATLTVDRIEGSGFEVSNNSALILSNSNSATFSGSISGSGSVSKEGTGTLKIDQDNTIGGDLTVSEGALQTTQNTTVVNGAASITGTNAPQLSISGPSTLEALDLNIGSGAGTSGAVLVEDTAALDVSNGLINVGYDQADGLLTQTGGTIVADTVTLGVNNGNGTVNLNGGTLQTYALDITTPTSKVAFDGGTLIAKDDMSVGDPVALAPSPTTISSGGATINTSLFQVDWNLPIDGTGALKKEGTGSLVLSANNTFSGGTTIAAGTLQLGAGGSTGTLSPTGAISNNGALVFESASNLIQATHFGPSISGTGSISQSGSGAVVLNSKNTHSGGTALNAGTLQALHAQALGSGPLELNSGRLVVGSAGANATVIQGIGDLRWNPDATITLESASRIDAGGNFTRLGSTPATHQFEAGSAQILNPGNNLLVSYGGGTDFTAADFAMETEPTVSLNGAFVLDENAKQLLYVLKSGVVTGSEISNATPAWADFLIDGVTTTAISPMNTIKSLTFQNSGDLQIVSGSSLQITTGQLPVSSGESKIIGGTLTTPGDLNKTGSGSLDIRSRVVAGGTVNIQEGLVAANGEIYAKNIVVGNAATLGGTGTIFAPVEVSGTLAPGNSIGTITIGSLTFNPGSQVIIEVASSSSSDVILVNGNAALSGTTLRVVPTDENSLSYGDRHTILVASGGISGQFDAIEVPQQFRGRLLNSGNTGTLLLAPDTYTRVATTPNERSAATALDSFIPATSGDRLAISIALDSLTEEEYPNAFEQVSPAIYANLPLILVEQAYNQAQLISQRLGFVRAGVGGGFQFAGVAEPELRYDRNGKSVIDPKTLIPLPQEAAVANWNAWVMGTGQFSNSNGWAGVPSGRNNAGGFLAGVDYQWTDEFATGVFGGFQYNQANYTGGGFAKGSGVTFGVYGTYSNDTGWYADGVIGGGYTAFQTRRTITFGTIDRSTDADPGAGQFNISLNLGKDWTAGNLRFGPVAGLQYTYASTSSFTEQGADSLDLAVSSFGTNSLRSTLGARAAYLWDLNEKLTLVPELRALWMHEFLNSGETLSTSLDGGRGASFDYETGSTYADSLFAGAGLGLKIGNQITASLFYNINFGGDSFINNIISTDVNVAF